MSNSQERVSVMTDSDRMCLANRFSIINVETRTFTIPQLHEFAKQIERDALERAAKVCDEWRRKNTLELCCDQAQHVALNAVAIAIRALARKE